MATFTGSSGRSLFTLDLCTGAATVIAPMSDNFAGLAFRIDGTLFGVTGDGANTPETLFTIDPATQLSGYDYDELSALASYTGGALIAYDLDDYLLAITTSGHVSMIAGLDHGPAKGMVYMPSPNTKGFIRPYGTGCEVMAGPIPFFFGSGTPAAGQTAGFHLLIASPNSFGVLALGFGSAPLPLPSPTCQVQINPVFASAGFVTGAAGDANFSLTIPSGFPPIDLFVQCGVVDALSLVVSNPLQMRTQ